MELRAEELCKSYGGRRVLDGVSLRAGPGITCIMAPSGAGKTTLLRILMGLEPPDRGRIAAGADFRWSAVFQEDRLLEGRSAAGNLRFVLGPELKGAAALLRRLGLDLEDPRPVRDYSGGMRRRLALARALLAPFDALALDEPFTGLDLESRSRCMACIWEAAAERPVLLVTHDPADTEGLPVFCLAPAGGGGFEGLGGS